MEAAKALYDKRLAALMKTGDANNTLYELESIYDYSEDTHGHFTHYYAAVWKS